MKGVVAMKKTIWLVLGVMILGIIGNPSMSSAKIRKPFLGLPVMSAKKVTSTSITFDFSYLAKYYLKGKDGISGFQVYKKTNGKWKKICTAKVSKKNGKKTIRKTLTQKNLKPNTNYQYRIRNYKRVVGTKKVKGKTKKYTKTFYSKYAYVKVKTKEEKKESEDTNKPKYDRYDKFGRPIDENGNLIDTAKEENENYQIKMLTEINRCRAERNIHPLVLDNTLCKMTEVRAKEAHELFAHRRLDGTLWSTIFDEFNLDYVENGSLRSVRARSEGVHGGSETWYDALQCWKESYGHWEDLMDINADRFGMGYYFDVKDGRYEWVAITGVSYEKTSGTY